jgi:hypothetical protein
MTRQFLFRNYWWIAAVAGVGAVAVSLMFGSESDRVTLVGSSVAGALAFCYFVQQQKLAEMSLFKQLFSEFNCRYDRMNGRLLDLTRHQESPTPKQRNLIVDYFNLCAEEYLFYSEGYIHEAVWCSWCRGMLVYFNTATFSSIWQEEIETGSYYGLSLDVIREGAGR